MATLRTNGPELLRITRERNADTSNPNDNDISWERVTRVYHENGAVLSKTDVIFRPTASFDPPEGRRHTWGWKKVILAQRNPNPVQRAKDVLAQIAKQTPGSAQWVVVFADRRIKAIAPTDPKYLAPEVQS